MKSFITNCLSSPVIPLQKQKKFESITLKELNTKLANVLSHNRLTQNQLPKLQCKLEEEKKKHERQLKTQRNIHEAGTFIFLFFSLMLNVNAF